MILLPVIERELRAAARSKWTYRQRFLAALAGILTSVWVIYQLGVGGVPEAALGSRIFQDTTLIALIFSLFAGVIETADAISQERREGTLGLLYLTDLKSSHVLWGKMAALSLPSFFALTTIVPILGIPILLGGVSATELACTSLVLLAGLAMSLSVGIFCSCLSKDDRVTRILTFLLILGPSVIFPVAGEVRASPLWTLPHAYDLSRVASPVEFWGSVGLQFAISFVLLTVSIALARAHWREQPSSSGWIRRDRLFGFCKRDPEKRRRRRAEALTENAAFWLCDRQKNGAAVLWIALVSVIACWAYQWFWHRNLDSFLFVLIFFLMHLTFKTVLALSAGNPVGDEPHGGALELLLTTPLTPRKLLEGHIFGLLKNFGPPAFIIIALTIAWGTAGRYNFAEDEYELFWVGGVFLFIDSVAIAYYATWLGLKLGRPGKAAMRTLIWILLVPDALFPILHTAFRRDMDVAIFWAAIDVVLIVRAILGLRKLREIASERFSASSNQG